MDFIAKCELIEVQIEQDFDRLIRTISLRKLNLLSEISIIKNEYKKTVKKLDKQKEQLTDNLPKDDIPFDNEVAILMNKVKFDIDDKILQIDQHREEINRVSINFCIDKLSIDCLLQNIGCITYQPKESLACYSITLLPHKPCLVRTDALGFKYIVTSNSKGLILDNNDTIILEANITDTLPVAKERKYGSMTVSDSNIFVSLTVEHFIAVFDKNWSFVHQLGAYGMDEGQLNLPQGMCSYGDLLYVCDSNNNRVQVYRDGKFNAIFGDTSCKLFNPVDIAICKSKEIFVLTWANPCIRVFNLRGDLLRVFCSLCSGEVDGVLSRFCITDIGRIVLVPRNTRGIYVYERGHVSPCARLGVGDASCSFGQITSVAHAGDEVIASDYRNSRLITFQCDQLMDMFVNL